MKPFLLVSVLILMYVLTPTCEGVRQKRGSCPVLELRIRNGGYKLSAGNYLVNFECNDGFFLLGKTQIVCFSSSWSSPAPICISNTCREISSTATLRVNTDYEGSMIRFSCAPLYKLEGEKIITCDGVNWSSSIPRCNNWTPPTSCDFESEDICGWANHEQDDQDWTRISGTTPTKRTGPEHDHTLGPNGNGYYMYYETSSPAREGHAAVLESPLYPASFSGRCFEFWYHALGDDKMGKLSVSVWTENQTISDLKPLYTAPNINDKDWLSVNLTVDYLTTPFKIYFHAVRGTGYRSDFAIDDVSLDPCPGVTTTTIATVVSTTKVQTTTTTTTTTTKTGTQSTTQSQTTTKVTRITTEPSTKTTTDRATTKDTTQNVTTMSTTKLMPSSTVQTTTPENTYVPGPNTTPRVNPNIVDGDPNPKRLEERKEDGSSHLIYILVGVAAVVAVVIVIAMALFCYRKRKLRDSRGTMSTVNPLYTAMGKEENATIQIDDSRYHHFS